MKKQIWIEKPGNGQGILWYGMDYGLEGKNRYGIWNGSSMEWNRKIDVWN